MRLLERGHHRHHRFDKPRPLRTLRAKKDVSLFEAFSYPWTSSLIFYKLLEIERSTMPHCG